MANKPKAKAKKSSASKASSSDSNVVRIKASSAPASKKKAESREEKETTVVKAVATKADKPAKAEKPAKVKATKTPGEKRKVRAPRPVRATGGYFKGAWEELRQVRWPNRRATWSLTGAVLAYTTFFVIVVLLLDAGFKYLFELILGK